MKTVTITSFLACAVTAAPVAQWVQNQPGGFTVNGPVGGFSIGPGGYQASGPLGGVSFTPGGPFRPQQQGPWNNGPQGGYNNGGGYGRGWHTDTGDNAAVEAETAQPEEAPADSAPAESVEGTN